MGARHFLVACVDREGTGALPQCEFLARAHNREGRPRFQVLPDRPESHSLNFS